MDATDGSSIATGTTRPDPNDPARMSEEYVSRLESELAALKASVQTMGSPGKTAASSAPPRATETGEHKSKSSLPAGPDKSGPARNAPPFGKATAVSKTTLDEDLAKAQAKYSDDRLAKFEKAMEEKFAASGGYDSDLEREMAAAEGMPNAHELAVGKVDAGKRAKALASEKAETDAVNAPFEKQNEWMDEYRRAEDQQAETKNAPISGAANLAERTATLVPADEDGKGDKGSGSTAVATNVSADEAASRNASKASTEATVAELDAARAAVAATRASAPATPIARARAPVAHKPAASFLGGGAHGDGLPRPDVLVRKTKRAATVPNPPSFLSRDASRAKTIAEQRLEHDLAVEAALEEAELKKRFVPKPVPKSTAEPRFTKMLETERLRRERLRETRKQALVETERPFSFYVRDKAKASEKGDPASAEALKARRANKFQRKFVAKAIPKAVKELRLPSMEAEAARRKEEARIAAEIALKEAAMPERMAKNVAEKNTESAPNASDDRRKKWSFQPAPRKPVPDFDALHAAFFRRLKEAKQQRPSTAVREFRLHEKSSPQRRAELRKIEKDMKEDQNVLPEVRWPFASLRAPVKSTPPPSFDKSVRPDFLKKNENLATKLRRQAVLRAKASGHYATKEEREALEIAEREAENRRRAQAWARSQTNAGNGAGLDARPDVAAAARRKQQSQIAKETVERVLMENNVYTYVEDGL
jgi:protein FAM161A